MFLKLFKIRPLNNNNNNNVPKVDVVTQAETIYELVHNMDQQVFKTIYSFGDQSSLAEDSTFAFTCRMGMLRHPRRNPNFDRYKVNWPFNFLYTYCCLLLLNNNLK